ncbi:MAG TPA: NAD(P)-dependent oxidoreductase [Streptosporangiaceae bacterium]
MSRPAVLFARDRFTAELTWTDLAGLLPGWTIRSCPSGQLAGYLDGIDVICPLGSRVDADLLTAGEFGLVQQFGVGLEKVDLAAAAERGVWAARVPGDATGNADSVAELAVLLLLALVRRLDEVRDALTGRRWAVRPTGGSLAGSTVAIVGLGAIGAALATRLAPFGVRLLAVRAHPERGGPPGLEFLTGPENLAGVLSRADAVVCAAMFEGGQPPLFDAAAFGAMRPGALFVNVARGGLVDEAALLAALESGQLGAAALDVYATEPADPDWPLLRHPRVLATPHVGGLTHEMFRRTGEAFAANLRRWAAGQPPWWAANQPAPGVLRRPPAAT